MALTVIFGVNGTGKDTLATAVQRSDPSIVMLSGSKILMKALGLDVDITTKTPIPNHYYQTLDALDLETANKLYDQEFPRILKEFKTTGQNTLLLYHLCIVKTDRNTNKITYDDDFVRDWYFDLFDQFVLIETSAQVIKERCDQDRNSGKRQRTPLALKQIEEQIQRSNQQWKIITNQLTKQGKNNYHVIPNNHQDVTIAVNELKRVIG